MRKRPTNKTNNQKVIRGRRPKAKIINFKIPKSKIGSQDSGLGVFINLILGLVRS